MQIVQIIMSLLVFAVASLIAYGQFKNGTDRREMVMWMITSLTSAASAVVLIAGVLRA